MIHCSRQTDQKQNSVCITSCRLPVALFGKRSCSLVGQFRTAALPQEIPGGRGQLIDSKACRLRSTVDPALLMRDFGDVQ